MFIRYMSNTGVTKSLHCHYCYLYVYCTTDLLTQGLLDYVSFCFAPFVPNFQFSFPLNLYLLASSISHLVFHYPCCPGLVFISSFTCSENMTQISQSYNILSQHLLLVLDMIHKSPHLFFSSILYLHLSSCHQKFSQHFTLQ